MNTGKYIGLIFLAILWAWLCVVLIRTGGFNLKNLLLIVATGIIIFVPLWKKYGKGRQK